MGDLEGFSETHSPDKCISENIDPTVGDVYRKFKATIYRRSQLQGPRPSFSGAVDNSLKPLKMQGTGSEREREEL